MGAGTVAPARENLHRLLQTFLQPFKCVLTASNARVVPPFQPRHSPLELVEIVRVVSLHVDARAPQTVSGRRWDDGRAGAGHPDAPRAFSIAKRLEVSWSDVLLVAHIEPELAWRRLSNLRSDKGRKGITLDRVLLALRQVAVRLDKPGIDRSDYERAREEMIAASRRARRGDAVDRAIPERTQVEELLRRHGLSWEEGLQRAGLSNPERKNRRAAPLVELVRSFVDEHEQLPRHFKQLERWANAHSISITRAGKGDGEAAAEAIAAVVTERRDAGLPELPIAPSNMAFTATGRVTGARAHIRDWDREKLIAGMALAVEILGPGAQLDQRSLKRIAAERRDLPIPSYSTVNRHLRRHYPDDTWEQWRREAHERAR